MQDDQRDSADAERFCKPKVGGSIPSSGTTQTLENKAFPAEATASTSRTNANRQRTADALKSAQRHTYFLRLSDAIKIGSSTKPDARISSLQTANPGKLERLLVVPFSIMEEATAHTQFDHLRIRGEWFRAEDELLDFIDGLRVKRGLRRLRSRPTLVTDYGERRNAILAERAIYASVPKGDTPLSHRAQMMVHALDNLFRWPENAEAGAAPKTLAADIQDVMLNGPPQIVGTYNPENPAAFLRA